MATGYGEDGAVRLPGAHVIGQLDLTSITGPALVADRLYVDSGLNHRSAAWSAMTKGSLPAPRP
ncbi:hypothetical protein [Kitasatospora sp. NPDC088346]|uniref:hypothetical protein n=1 Tax=Kitasatospora sp. NPDC088346 TaxID=3364073 RepID=UPI00380C7F41